MSYYFDNRSKTSKLLFVYRSVWVDITSDQAAVAIYRIPLLYESQILLWSFLFKIYIQEISDQELPGLKYTFLGVKSKGEVYR